MQAASNQQAAARTPQPNRPPVVPLPNQSAAPSNPETIGNYLDGLTPPQLYDMVAKMKIVVQQNPDQARQLLLGNPHFAYALLQAEYLLGMINVQTVQKLIAKTQQLPPRPMGGPIPPMQGILPTGVPMNPPLLPTPNFQPPPVQFQPVPMKTPNPYQPPQQTIPDQYIAQAFGDVQLQDQQKELLQQVVNLTPEQIEALPPEQRQQVQQLRQTLLGGFAPNMPQWR